MRRLLTAALIAALAGTAGLAGCTERSPKPAASGPATDIRAAAVGYAQCMRERGYDLPDPTFDEQGLPSFPAPAEIAKGRDFAADQRACRPALDSALRAAGVKGMETATNEQLIAFTRCVREQGLDVPDPDPQGGLQLDKATLTSPAWPAAAEACKHHLPPEYGGIGKTKG